MIIHFKKTHPEATTPAYSRDGDACVDLTATAINITQHYFEYDTGIAVEIPKGHVGLCFPRSSVTNKGLFLGNSVGVIDESFRGSIKFRFYANDEFNHSTYKIGDRIGQLMVIPIPQMTFIEKQELSDSIRGSGGFGSSGN